ncbi:unnamed protein product, partial [Polarella glacialis]
ALLLGLGSLSLEQCRLLEVPVVGLPILLAECPGDLGIGGRVWDGGLVLLEYLAEHRSELLGRRCLELGSGTGLVGMGCALLGARQVLLTDLEDVTPLLRLNLELNQEFNPFLAVASSSAPGESAALPAALQSLDGVEVLPHRWGTDISSLDFGSTDLVVMADVVYDIEAAEALIATLQSLASVERQTEAKYLMAFRPRNVEDPAFFKALEAANFELHERPRLSTPMAKMCTDVIVLELIPRRA